MNVFRSNSPEILRSVVKRISLLTYLEVIEVFVVVHRYLEIRETVAAHWHILEFVTKLLLFTKVLISKHKNANCYYIFGQRYISSVIK